MRRIKKVGSYDNDLDLKSFMNLFSVLIPFLLACASFASIKLLDINLPENRVMTPQQVQQKDMDDQGLLLTVFITDEGITLGARGAMLPTTYVQEWHKYVYAFPQGSDQKETYLYRMTKENKLQLPRCPQDPKRVLTLFEREEILLYTLEKSSDTDTGKVMQAVYNKFDEPMTYASGLVANQLPNQGDTLYVLSMYNRRMEVVGNVSDYKLKEHTLYDQLASRLMVIKSKYPDVPDQGEIKIVAEDEVVFDKLIHVMDICREFGFPKISLAKLAG
ncbi:MAG: hypothetical protein A2293_11045 [Elusimicrobia bacterium RIFOXYB2_FULL_49_7]|nr:MAG: hypothetical protein A2293_11045 [Elusimicrobia bacterium RIFOXYB2_FULL_49_7]